MAILRSVVDVNNGNTGWTKADVMDALETVFANLGMHGGTATTGVPQWVGSPTNSRNYNNGGFDTAARDPGIITYNTHYIDAISQGTTAYRMLKKYYFPSFYGPNSATDEITFNTRHEYQTGDQIHWAPGETDGNLNINGLSLDTVYYVIRVSDQVIKLAANASDATNDVAIDLTQGPYTDSAAVTTNLSYFRDIDDAQFDNRTINVGVGDVIYFNVSDTSGGTFNLCGGTDDYDANKLLSDPAWRDVVGQPSLAALPSGNNIPSGACTWNTYYWHQTEDERNLPDEQIPLDLRSNTEKIYSNYGLVKYIYASSTESAMKGEIVINPARHSNTGLDPYFKYTVPASGGRSELKLRIYRGVNGNGHVEQIVINSIGSGWANGEVFTIPGDQIGGSTPEDDIRFGTATPETFSGANDGICEVHVTNLGSGSNFYQKSDYGYFGVLKVVNDASKNYGTSYYGFGTSNYADYDLYINTGSHWEWMNRYGTKTTDINGATEYGRFGGILGLDTGYARDYINRSNNAQWSRIRIATTSTPTAYPMSIRVYRAQAPQDTNFAVIQFTQTINGEIIPYGTFTVHTGAAFGANLWDLYDVFIGTISTYEAGTRTVNINYTIPGYYNYNDMPGAEPVNDFTRARESSYGFARDPNASYQYTSKYACNIDTDNNESSDNQIMTYYRNSTYDRNGDYAVSTNADYYKPIKGLPLVHNIAPCPYYLPDDFVMLQFSTTPGATVFRPGDTVTISPSEIYEVMLAGYQTSQNGLDNVNNNSSIGMLFLARTT